MKTLNHNYTSICWYCGGVFKSNRSTAKHCSSSHKSLYRPNRNGISPYARDRDGEYFDAAACLKEAYEYSGNHFDYVNGWSVAYQEVILVRDFYYDGPFPTGAALLVVVGYLIRFVIVDRRLGEYGFQIKPIHLLTKEEKEREIFLQPDNVNPVPSD